MSPEARPVGPKPQTGTGWSADQVKAYTDERIGELQRAVDVAREGEPPHVQLQYYIEKIMDEQRRGLTVAEQEREKAANALRIELDRAISEGDRALREHIDQQFQQIRAALDSADLLELERVKLVDAKVDSYESTIGSLREVIDEKFNTVSLQFAERDTRQEREARDNKLAVDAAFAAQEKQAVAQNDSNTLAINKSEQATAETINKLAELFKSTTDSLSDKIDALTTRLDKLA